MKKSHLELAQLCARSYREFEYEVRNIECSLIDNVWVFRGTDELADWLTNFRVMPWLVEDLGWVHKGFYRVAGDVFEHVLVESVKSDLDVTEFQFTGHSLGGAVALFMAAFMKKHGWKIRDVVTFGAPCVGQLDLLNDERLVLYRNGRDIVPMLPLIAPQPAPLIKIGKPSRWHWNIRDHRIENYVSALTP